MPGPRFARNLPTGVSAPSEASSSTRLSPTRTATASTPCSATVSRPSTCPPKSLVYVSTASSRSSTATPRWWMPFARTRRMLSVLGYLVLDALERDDAAHGLAGTGLRLHVREQREHLVADERLLFEEGPGEAVERHTVLRDQTDGLLVRAVGQPRLLLVAHPLRLLGERVVVGPHRPRDDAVRHAVFEDHGARELGHLLEVVRCAVRDAPEDDLLGRAAGKSDLHPVDELLAGVEVPVLRREVERIAESHAAGDDRRLLDGEALAHQMGHKGVPALVVGQDPLLLLRHHTALL